MSGPSKLERLYAQAIHHLIDEYMVLPTFETLGELNAKLVQYGQIKNFPSLIAESLSKRMITMAVKVNTGTWRQAASKAGNSRTIFEMLRQNTSGFTGNRINELVKENASLIKALPRSIGEGLSKHIAEQYKQGLRTDAILKTIAPEVKHLKAWEARRLARTQVASADTSITRARAEDIGLSWYQWETSEDQRVRPSHRKMDNVLVNFNDPPNPESLVGIKGHGNYNAGNDYNCRCLALPVVSLDEISWPARVYQGGTIHRISRSQFALLSGIPKRIAA